MSDDLRDLVGDDVPPEELARLARVDALLRSTPAPPPELPASLTTSVGRVGIARPLWTRRRILAAAALAAALAAVFFGVGRWAGGDGDADVVRVVEMTPTAAAADASATLSLGRRDDAGNWDLLVRASGLPQLPPGGYYVLWLDRDGEYAGTCGTFNVSSDGSTSVQMSASYRLADYDGWVVTAWLPNADNAKAPRLLEAEIDL